MTFDRFRVGGWLVPSLCLALTGGMILFRCATFARAHDQNSLVEARLLKAQEETSAIRKLRQASRFACAPARKDEETKFLKGLRRHARLAGVSIVRLSSHLSTYDKDAAQGGPAPEAAPPALLAGVTKIGTDLTLDGSYPELRRFLQGLWNSDRLYTMSNVGWIRKEHGSELTMTLNRYVASATPKISTP